MSVKVPEKTLTKSKKVMRQRVKEEKDSIEQLHAQLKEAQLPNEVEAPFAANQTTHVTSGNAHCPGCGVKLQTQDKEAEGYLDPKAIETHIHDADVIRRVEKTIKATQALPKNTDALRRELTDAEKELVVNIGDMKIYEKYAAKPHVLICQRCHQLNSYSRISSAGRDVGSKEEYIENLRKLRAKKNILVVKVIDLLSPENSFIPDFAELIGPKHPVILVANKADLLPTDASYPRITELLAKLWKDWVTHHNQYPVNLISIMMVSSTSGINIKKLASRIETFRDGGDVYIVGSTNVGKSTLINRLINLYTGSYDTDYQISKVPLIPLNNPVVLPSSPGNVEDAISRKIPIPKLTTSSLPGTTLSQVPFILKNTQAQAEKKEEKESEGLLKVEDVEKDVKKKSKKESTSISHLYDTPGIPNPTLPVNYLPPSDFKYVFPKKKIVPQYVRMRPGRSLFIGGLVRIDYEFNDTRDDWNRVFFTIFASSYLPFHATKTENKDRIYEGQLGKRIYPPFNHNETPELVGLDKEKVFNFQGTTRMKAVADIVIGGVGWVSITGVGNMTISVHYPSTLHVISRDVPIMPFETYKLKKSQFYDTA